MKHSVPKNRVFLHTHKIFESNTNNPRMLFIQVKTRNLVSIQEVTINSLAQIANYWFNRSGIAMDTNPTRSNK